MIGWRGRDGETGGRRPRDPERERHGGRDRDRRDREVGTEDRGMEKGIDRVCVGVCLCVGVRDMRVWVRSHGKGDVGRGE